jgi:hypothetical protein
MIAKQRWDVRYQLIRNIRRLATLSAEVAKWFCLAGVIAVFLPLPFVLVTVLLEIGILFLVLVFGVSCRDLRAGRGKEIVSDVFSELRPLKECDAEFDEVGL